MPCIKSVLAEVKPDVALMTETHLTEDRGVIVEGYTFFGKSRTKGKGGGVGIFIKSDLKSTMAPHYTQRDLEILWLSVSRKCAKPIYIGVYYGKQETTCNKNIIQTEMENLSDEILELKQEGEVIICMDANAKVGLMGEEHSRNGRLMEDLFNECEMTIINRTKVCKGVITRQNRKRPEERSAIDLVASTYEATQWITNMEIDESGDYRMRGINESDHNTILVSLEVANVRPIKDSRRTTWNLKAPEEKVVQFKERIRSFIGKATMVMKDQGKTMDERYQAWERLLYKAAISTIGKTTAKSKCLSTSETMKTLRNQRRQLKKDFEKEANPEEKRKLLNDYIMKQQEVRDQACHEECERVKGRLQRMEGEHVQGQFWKERKLMKKDETSSWLITKDDQGQRIYDPELNKENIANYYEQLFSKIPRDHHPYHDEVKAALEHLKTNRNDDGGELDEVPTLSEVKAAILNKKNGKSTTDWKNEIIKLGGEEMARFVYPVICAFWQEESPPQQWNLGLMTNVWKGKGDREVMENQRGITVSSAIGTIAEEIVFNRVSKVIQFTQAQAGGRKGGSTADHVFVLKNTMALAKKQRRNLIITFYDVAKAYDKADMDNMLFCINQAGVKGKLWRLVKSLNEGLSAQIKTKAGLTRKIQRDTGGKQGGKLIVPLFAKTMDTLPEEMIKQEELGAQFGDSKIPCLVYMDDAISFAEEYTQQELTLRHVNEFALKHKLDWGQKKCQTMEVGTHRERKASWKLGDLTIGKCDSYRYLGEQIMRNGRNDANLQERCEKMKTSTRAIITCCRSEVMKRIGMKVILQLHESETIPAFLYNAETWTLSKTEKKMLDMAETQAWKRMIGLPQTTPTAGIILTTGSLFASIRIEVKQLLFLHRILKKQDDHWTKTTLLSLKQHDCGWAKQICNLLEQWELPQEWADIEAKRTKDWKEDVYRAAERRNKLRLKEECEVKSRGTAKLKTKTHFVTELLEDTNYLRKPANFICQHQSVVHARALIMGRFHMLKCANNFSTGFGSKLCAECNIIDSEDHRINACKRWSNINLCNSQTKLNFDDIYSEDTVKCLKVVETILSLWDLENGRNEMRSTDS